MGSKKEKKQKKEPVKKAVPKGMSDRKSAPKKPVPKPKTEQQKEFDKYIEQAKSKKQFEIETLKKPEETKESKARTEAAKSALKATQEKTKKEKKQKTENQIKTLLTAGSSGKKEKSPILTRTAKEKKQALDPNYNYKLSKSKQTDAAFKQFFNIGEDGKRDTGKDTQMTRARQAERTKSETERLRAISDLRQDRIEASKEGDLSKQRSLTRLADKLEKSAPTISKNPFAKVKGRAKSFEASLAPVRDPKTGKVIDVKSTDPSKDKYGRTIKDKDKPKTIVTAAPTPPPEPIVEESVDVSEAVLASTTRGGKRSKRFGGAAVIVKTLLS
jgi:hypothetical protein